MKTEQIYTTDTQFEVDTIVPYLAENHIEAFVETREDVNHPYLIRVRNTDYLKARELINEYARDHQGKEHKGPLHTKKTLRILRIACTSSAALFGIIAYGAFLNEEKAMAYFLAGISALFLCMPIISIRWKAKDDQNAYNQ
jgi:hypothetical protein